MRTLLTLLISASLFSLVSPAPATAAPARPLLLVGGTFGGQDSPGWAETTRWLRNDGGYREQDLFIGEMQRQTAMPSG